MEEKCIKRSSLFLKSICSFSLICINVKNMLLAFFAVKLLLRNCGLRVVVLSFHARCKVKEPFVIGLTFLRSMAVLTCFM